MTWKSSPFILFSLLLFVNHVCTLEFETYDDSTVLKNELATALDQKHYLMAQHLHDMYQVTYSLDDFRSHIPAVLGTLLRSPIRRTEDRVGGIMINHILGLWTFLKRIQPEYIIESGVHRGFSTWVMRQVVPHAKFFCIDPRPTPLLYEDSNAVYFKANSFKDFAEIDWDAQGIDKNRTVIFFDDHMDHLRRMEEAQARGFRYLIFDDNNNPVTGDCYTIRHMLHGTYDFVHSLNLAAPYPSMYEDVFLRLDNFGHERQEISYEEHARNADRARSLMKAYTVTPPLLWQSGILPGQKLYSVKTWMSIDPPSLFETISDLTRQGWRPVPFDDKPEAWELTYYFFLCLVELNPLQ